MHRDSKAFKERFQRWKNGEQVYDKGRPIELPEYGGGKDSELVEHGIFAGRLASAMIGKQKYQKNLEESNYLNKQKKIASTKDYGWKGDSRGWMNKEHSKQYIDPAWRLSDIPIFGLLHNAVNPDNKKDASPTEQALYNRHLGYSRDLELMPIPNTIFAGDFTKDGKLKRAKAEYTGLSKTTKDAIRNQIGNKIKVNDDGSWTQYDLGQIKGMLGWDIAPELKNFSIRENNQSDIYDVFDTYDFDFWHKMHPIKNRLDGQQIEVRDTIWGPNANPDLYNPMYTKVGYKNGKDSIRIKPSHRGRLTALKKRTGKSEAELWKTGGPSVRKMITFARNARKWKH